MRRRDSGQLAKLVRLRRLGEDRAQLALGHAKREREKADRAFREANDRVNGISEWKTGAGAGGGIALSLYEHALVLEQEAVAVADEAALARRATDESTLRAAGAYEDAAKAARVASRRMERLRLLDAWRRERSEADAAADLWLARAVNVDA